MLSPVFLPVMLSTLFCRRYPFFVAVAHRLGGDLLERELVVAGRRVDVEEDRAGVLAERQRAVARQSDVAADDVQRDVGIRSFDLVLARAGDRADDVVRQDGRRAPDQFEDRFEEVRFRRDAFNRLRGRAHAVLREGSLSDGDVSASPMDDRRSAILSNPLSFVRSGSPVTSYRLSRKRFFDVARKLLALFAARQAA